jgi:pimeloyl-ACP methyl ester carboxylesterase
MSEDTRTESPDHFVELRSGTRICFRDHGDPAHPAILLVAGLGEDLTFWGGEFVTALLARGYRVITMDNRDVGRSSFATTPAPGIWRQALARPRADGYTLTDMAQDCIGLLDHLGIERVHLVGRSMGGMIAQTIAATVPARVLSLTSMYSTTGSTKVGQPAKSTILKLVFAKAPQTRTDAVRAHLRITQHIAGTGYAMDEAEESLLAGRAWDRRTGDGAAGEARQIQAIQLSGDRTEQLRRITAPTLVINGDRDLLVAPSGGQATAAAIPSAQHVVIPGMGHHLPGSLVEPVVHYIAGQADRVEEGGSQVEIS